MKKAILGLRNQMHLDDYWRRILAEVVALKHPGKDLPDALLPSGGSSHQLGQMEDLATPDMRKAMSLDNLAEREAVDGSSHLLVVPGVAVQDTVRSLREFLTSSQLPQPPWLEQGLRCPGEDAPTRLILGEEGLTLPRAHLTSPQAHLTLPQGHLTLPQGLANRRISTSHTNSQVGQILEQTTIGEFLVAVENVRKKSVMALPTLPASLPGSRRSSAVSRGSGGEGRGGREEEGGEGEGESWRVTDSVYHSVHI